jgi:hypothetical protein
VHFTSQIERDPYILRHPLLFGEISEELEVAFCRLNKIVLIAKVNHCFAHTIQRPFTINKRVLGYQECAVWFSAAKGHAADKWC